MRKFLRSESGLSLIDAMVALAIVATAAVGFVAAIGTGSMTAGDVKAGTIAQSLARSQLEYVKELPFDTEASSYPSVTAPEGYTVSANVSSVPGADEDIQKITVTVTRGGAALLVVEEYKLNR